MASNAFGKILTMTTFGESHGPGVGVVIDGLPPGLSVSADEISMALRARAPGHSLYTSARAEKDSPQIISGVFEGKTTGTPFCVLVPNEDAQSSSYEAIAHLVRPGHAHYTYREKYGIFDYRGGGRASARETICRIVGGVIAKKIIQRRNIQVVAYLQQVGSVQHTACETNVELVQQQLKCNELPCPDAQVALAMAKCIHLASDAKDSVGGVVEFRSGRLPTGLGDPVYEKLSARLAYALMSIPGAKGVEIGSGFQAASMRGSEHNDRFFCEEDVVHTSTNHAGGILGGISNGMPLVGRVAFKPTSTIAQPMETIDNEKRPAVIQLPDIRRHDPCIALRAVPVVESMVCFVLADALLASETVRAAIR